MPTAIPERIGRYQVLRRLGGGGMGTVFLGRDPQLDRLVALKLLKDDLTDLPDVRERFTREARSAAKLRHPNIVTIFDIGEHEGRAFIAMEHVPGEPLSEMIRRRDPIPLTRKLALIEMLCAGLHHAHGAGIVHRDVKPANLMVDADGVLKIVDFGIARVADSAMTHDGMLVGSMNYMSPEQVWGRPVDHRSDIFAVGAVCYELLAYQMAFPGGMSDGVFVRICQEPPPPLGACCPGLDPEIIAIVDRALQKDPAARYQDLAALARDVAGVRARLGPDAVDLAAAMTSAVTLPPGATPVPRSTPPFVPTPPPATPSGTPRPLHPTGVGDRGSGPPSGPGSGDPERRRRTAEVCADAAQTALDQHDYPKALSLIERAVSFDPGNPALAALARQIADAAEAAREASERRRELDQELDAAEAALGRRDLAGARAHVDRARTLSPADERLHRVAVRLERADAAARQVSAARPGSGGTVYVAAAPRRRLPLLILAAILGAAAVGLALLLR